jgi:hypothetical protein
MFIREYLAGRTTGNQQTLGEDIASPGVGFPAKSLFNTAQTATEAVLVEAIQWCAQEYDTDEGVLLLALVNPNSDVNYVGCYELEAGTATQFASGRIPVSIVVPPGYQLRAAHTVKGYGGSYTYLYLNPIGGVLR